MSQPERLLHVGALVLGTALVASGCASQPKAEQPAEPEQEEQPEPTVQEREAPEPEPQATAVEPEEKRVANGMLRAVPGEDQGTYTVGQGDTLWDIAAAEAIYGDAFAWPLIYKHNSDKIEDADLIYPDQEFLIQWEVGSTAYDAAVRHAKTRGSWSLGRTERSDLEYLEAN
ncbi:hypothetical protein AN478_05840 [Thiohalorhabdus denitrificans]|uniref:LysM domain-containing protein n=1 Tax=Thiohalorhabdus denitrificans TaxID=381306 RepID=A0A0P9C726_9GAMM|nr:LysM peptidoglycan-binding domain-containing protein [Thiohalorhabdus denitrificans]KPV40678.1 hypothetical protein AN478_05840 [Thiohalorhabdus denitrificans]SCY47224.1 hypothetical protein SAMN05661077_2210 [Thiohalorhabdus denitrificans]